ncbi:hypothetical protein D1872_281020 [compost metagenome]
MQGYHGYAVTDALQIQPTLLCLAVNVGRRLPPMKQGRHQVGLHQRQAGKVMFAQLLHIFAFCHLGGHLSAQAGEQFGQMRGRKRFEQIFIHAQRNSLPGVIEFIVSGQNDDFDERIALP